MTETKNVRVKINQDINAESPREWDNIGTMLCKHRKYILGDIQLGANENPKDYINNLFFEHATEKEIKQQWLKINNFKNLKESDESIKELKDSDVSLPFPECFVVLPVYAYIHSGITIKTGPYSCSWDSGMIGYIFCNVNEAQKEIVVQEGEDVRKRLEEILKSEIKIYDYYLTGAVYSYTIEEQCPECNEWHHVDSCGGFYGYDEDESGIIDAIMCELDLSKEETLKLII